MHWLCDNLAVFHAVNKQSCFDPDMMSIIRCLFFLEAQFCFKLVVAHLPGRKYMLVADLSRNRLSDFSETQSPDSALTPIPPELQELLLEHEGWTFPRWTGCFSAIATTDYWTPRGEHIELV